MRQNRRLYCRFPRRFQILWVILSEYSQVQSSPLIFSCLFFQHRPHSQGLFLFLSCIFFSFAPLSGSRLFPKAQPLSLPCCLLNGQFPCLCVRQEPFRLPL